ncbi:glutaredoxin [bacterium]|nr:Grx4 family monothiol glutaredoxin [bacterium]MDA9754097.1 Grx4 family monothiol glutaredoxin [bacterium]MEC7925183.1 Grx4 family monothiol glutaredoxin [Thermodesulfobacteriota bacterium]GIR28815.1 MAG: glutaredoxin [bacterium]|tara:strand:+ start:2874 stop:3182 length:309 start_codon:yes stop_codon:yes gene_type:complete
MNNIAEEIKKTISENKIVLYMKGTPESPQCGFSAKVVQILNDIGTIFISYDVLANPELRSGIKDFSNWPTIPQLYVNGEFIGGCDICIELYEKGELANILDN